MGPRGWLDSLHTRTHTHTHIFEYTHTHTHTHTYAHTHIHIRIHTHTCTHTHIFEYTRTHSQNTTRTCNDGDELSKTVPRGQVIAPHICDNPASNDETTTHTHNNPKNRKGERERRRSKNDTHIIWGGRKCRDGKNIPSHGNYPFSVSVPEGLKKHSTSGLFSPRGVGTSTFLVPPGRQKQLRGHSHG